MNAWLSILVGVVLMTGLLLIPLGLPGLWLIVGTTLALFFGGFLPASVPLLVAGAAILAEVSELLVVARFGRVYGGSRRAFWGAVLGGTAGLFFGLPVPVVGSVITAFLGTFVGAGLATFAETRSVGASARVGWGVLLARTVAVAMKVAVATGVIAFVVFSLIF
ncbi:MAG: DUF456 family protein [Longimicrobiales bacterium]|nr:DUF456 family protein [Longimicrobiales bacterium]